MFKLLRYQLSAFSSQLSALSFQLSAFSFRLSTFNVFFLLVGLSVPAITLAQVTPEILSNTATPNFPSDIVFELVLGESHTIVQAELTFKVDKWSCLEADVQVPVELEGTTASWTWVLSRSGNLPPGSQVEWNWTLTDNNGRVHTTPTQTLLFEDPRYNWHSLTAEGITLYWYDGDRVGPTLLDASVESLARLESEMGIELQEEVNIYIYGSSEDMRQAVLYIQEWAGGVAFTEYNTILMGVPPRSADSWGIEVVPHELAHLVIAQYGRSCVGGARPTWLDEGLAVYAEGPPDSDTITDIQTGLSENSFQPIRSLSGSFGADHSQAGLAYSQSYSIVNYLLQTYGQEKMQMLLLTLADGLDTDAALQHTYGFNMDGLENEWRTAVGAEPRLIPPTPTPFNIAAIPTYRPSGQPQSVPTPPAAANPPQAKAPERPNSLCFLGWLPLLAAALIKSKRM